MEAREKSIEQMLLMLAIEEGRSNKQMTENKKANSGK